MWGLSFYSLSINSLTLENVSLILLNVGMYVGVPAIVVVGIRKKF
jgi:hypothetical protein